MSTIISESGQCSEGVTERTVSDYPGAGWEWGYLKIGWSGLSGSQPLSCCLGDKEESLCEDLHFQVETSTTKVPRKEASIHLFE